MSAEGPQKSKRTVLVMDPFTLQSYDVVLALKDQYRIVVLLPELGFFRRVFCPAANSLFADKVCSWDGKALSGLLGVIKDQKVDIVFPTADQTVLYLARHKERIEACGCLVPVNGEEATRRLMDKYEAVNFARARGVPAPQTIAAEDLRGGSSVPGLIFPCVAKPRIGNTGRGVSFLLDQKDLERWRDRNSDRLSEFCLQEYVPGDRIVYFRVYMNKEGECVRASCASSCRPGLLVFQTRGLLLQADSIGSLGSVIIDLFRSIGLVGYAHVQLKEDERNGDLKMMEINTRISQGTWAETASGWNGPLAQVTLFEGGVVQPSGASCGEYGRYTWPVQDGLILMRFFVQKICDGALMLLGRKAFPALPGVRSMLSHYRAVYLSGKKRCSDNYTRVFWLDPLVGFCRWLVFSFEMFVKQEGWRRGERTL